MAETSPVRGRWAIRHVPPTPRSIVELIRAGTLDAELAATLWLLVEGRVPLIVGARARLVGKSTLLEALLMFLPPGVRTVELEGAMEAPQGGLVGSELQQAFAKPGEPIFVLRLEDQRLFE